jgi:tRNA-dihydrouridine synthase C
MDGVTDPAFRGLVLDLGDAGGAVTEFVRVTTGPISVPVLRRELGPPRSAPVGLQVMTPGPEHLAGTVANAARAGAAWVDLNFGCPAKRVFGKCAGSALLADPGRVGAIVAAAAGASDLPVSAKIRAGIEDPSPLEEVLHAAAGGGAAMVTLHARLRTDSYAAAARWEWIARAAEVLRRDHPGVLLVGNGGIERAGDAARMIRETGCDGVMVGRAALADPFLFREIRGGPPAGPAEAAAFAVRYLHAVLAPGAVRGGVGKAKQFVKSYRAGGLFEGREGERRRLLAEAGAEEILLWFRREEGPSPEPAPTGTGFVTR